MEGIYNYIPQTNRVSRVYSVAAVLYLQFLLHVMLFRTFTLALSIVMGAVPNVAFLCSSLTLCFPGMLLRYFLSDFEMVPEARTTRNTAITFAFTFQMR